MIDNNILRRNMLFRNFTDDELYLTLNYLGSRSHNYAKGESILIAGDVINEMGIVISGNVSIETLDIEGNRSVLSQVGSGGVFAETFAMLSDAPIPVDVISLVESEILFVSIWRVNHIFEKGTLDKWEAKLLTNLLKISNQKNRVLSEKNIHTSPKSVRGRVESFLYSMSLKTKSNSFDIPYNRQEMADYLNVERTALSAELGRMKKDGIIDFKKNHFKILEVGI